MRSPRRQTTSAVFPRIGYISITFTIKNPLITVWEAHRSCLKIAVFNLGRKSSWIQFLYRLLPVLTGRDTATKPAWSILGSTEGVVLVWSLEYAKGKCLAFLFNKI